MIGREEATPPQPPRDLDYRKWLHEQQVKAAERAFDRSNEFHDTINNEAVTNAREAIKGLMLVNGGAAIAMLGFAGALASKGGFDIKQLAPIANSLVWFTCGVAIGVLCFGFSYLTNYGYAAAIGKREFSYEHPYLRENAESAWWRKFATRFHWTAIILSLVSLGCFLFGIWSVHKSIIALGSN